MSKGLLVVVSLLCACNRTERTNGAGGGLATAAGLATSAPVVTAPAVSSRSSAAASGNAIDAGKPPLAASVASEISPAASAVRSGTKHSVVPVGYPSGLRLEADTLTYCDNRGGRALDLTSGVERARERRCDKDEERNSGCGDIDFVRSVREPDQDDIIDPKEGDSIPVHGHVHDCAFSSGVLLVATPFEVVAIDAKTGHSEVKSKQGDQVAINRAWLAWSDGAKVFAQRR